MNQFSLAERADFFLEGEKYFKFYLKLIQNAQSSIHLHTYIFEMDSFGRQVYDALLIAAARGVKVYLLVDDVGSKSFKKNEKLGLASKNIYYHRFNSMSLIWVYQWGRRLHHKILLIDTQKALIGGINVTKSGYGHKHYSQQLDFAIYVEGVLISELNSYCSKLFNKIYKKKKLLKSPVLQKQHHKTLKTSIKKIILIKMSINDWVFRRWQISQRYSNLIQKANTRITIINPYFFPRQKIIRQLIAASQRNVCVRLILPKYSDWPSCLIASEFLFSDLLKNKVEIYLWNKSILHGKLVSVDSQHVTIGSFNLNYTSYQQNLELNIDVDSQKFTNELDTVLQELITVGCEKVELVQFTNSTHLRKKIIRFIYYHILSLIAHFSVLLIYRFHFKEKSVHEFM